MGGSDATGIEPRGTSQSPISQPGGWYFGGPIAATIAAWAITPNLTEDPTPLYRGAVWTDAGKIRLRLLGGGLAFQVSAGATYYQVGTYAIGHRADDGVTLSFTADTSNGVARLSWVWGQTAMGDLDPANCIVVILTASGGDTWDLAVKSYDGGMLTTVYSDAITSFECPIGAIGIEVHGGMFTVWAGPTIYSMRRLLDPFASAILPDRVAIGAEVDGTPNDMWRLLTFYRQTDCTF